MKHNISSKIIAVIMAMIMAVGVSAQAYAASTTKYISEMVIATGSSLAAAKKKLTNSGYTPISENCSPDFGYTVIGVKTTTNVKEAITDVAVMNMNGNYSFQEYENVLKQYEDEANILIDELRAAFEEFRANVEAGESRAIMAKAILNKLTDEDYKDAESDKLGDIICSKDFTDKELSVIMMQSTDYCITTLETALSLGVATDWIDSFVNAPSEQIYNAEDYNAVDRISGLIKPLQDQVKEYEDVIKSAGLDSDADISDCTEAYESLSDYDKSVINGYNGIYALLTGTQYKNGTLYDFFMKDYDSFEPEDLLPLVKALTPGQLATVPYVGLTTTMQNTLAKDELIEKTNENLGITEATEKGNEADEESDDTFEELETISIFAGVDRSIFEPGGIALTSEAIANINSSNDTSWIKSRITAQEKKTFGIILGAATATAVVGGAIWAIGAHFYKGIFAGSQASHWGAVSLIWTENPANVAAASTAAAEYTQAYQGGIIADFSGTTAEEAARGAGYLINQSPDVTTMAIEQATAETANSGYKLMATAGKVITGVSLAVLFITAIIYLVKIKKQQAAESKIEFLEIPRIIVEQKTLEDKSNKYVYYYAAKSITDNGHSEYGDLNNFKTPQWIALYYTKDTAAGNPVKASAVTLSKSQASDSKYDLGVHMFNNGGVYDLNPYPSDSVSEASHVYIFFETESSANLTATSMNYGFYAISAVAGLAIGALGMFFIDKSKLKKKAKTDSETPVA